VSYAEKFLWLTYQILIDLKNFGATFRIGGGQMLPLPPPGYAPGYE